MYSCEKYLYMEILDVNIMLAMMVTFLWGTTAAATHLGFMDWPPLALAALRALPAGLILLALKPTLPKSGQWRSILANAGINITLFFTLVFLVAQNLPATLAAVGMSATPLVALVVTMVVSRTFPGIAQALVALLLVGVTSTLFNPSSEDITVVGVVSMIAAMLVMVMGSMYLKHAMLRIDWWTMVVWQLILGGLMLLPLGILQWWLDAELYVSALNFDADRVLTGLWLVLANTALAYAVFMWVLTRISVVQFAFASIANPVGGILVGAVLVQEQFSSQEYLLMLVMIGASLIAQMLSQQKRPQHNPELAVES
ncbi:DMT family transporter [Hahella ganghwensis]|uniref:DMT family transporter n=1 Tax=Hahella ganghwensis TaxID=286420 RepID=UPI0003703F08|nr:EamA family transporter [Hahella ganghwensis]